MWVRSQDRKKLTEIHDATIYHDKQIWAGCSFIGEYSTEEKAMKVMDMLQWSLDDGVVEMPLDDDVEELYNSYDI